MSVEFNGFIFYISERKNTFFFYKYFTYLYLILLAQAFFP